MKKHYMEPQTKLFSVKICHLICDSLPYSGNAYQNGIKSADSRRGRFTWDDDEEDEW